MLRARAQLRHAERVAERFRQARVLDRCGVIVDEVQAQQPARGFGQGLLAGDDADPADMRQREPGLERFQVGIAEAALQVEHRRKRLVARG
ncbi:hypothetical protein D3C72_1591370 [compost metagenome]